MGINKETPRKNRTENSREDRLGRERSMSEERNVSLYLSALFDVVRCTEIDTLQHSQLKMPGGGCWVTTGQFSSSLLSPQLFSWLQISEPRRKQFPLVQWNLHSLKAFVAGKSVSCILLLPALCQLLPMLRWMPTDKP